MSETPSLFARLPRRVPLGAVLAGAAVALVCSVIGFARPLLPAAAGMPGMGTGVLHGMALGDMPEMFVAAGGIVLAVAGALGARGIGGGVAGHAVALSARRRALVAVVATAALTIDISKTSTLGFVIPGMRAEYGLGAQTASLLAVGGLSGTAAGALLSGRVADRIGRRATYLVATLGFAATSMCGCMPTFSGNVVMCFLMGVTVGGLAPLLVTLLADLFGGPTVTALSVFATAVGYLMAAGAALWLEPPFGWRMLWLVGAPTGLALAAATALFPDRVRRTVPVLARTTLRVARTAFSSALQRIYAVAAGLATFGLTTWVPTLSRSGGLTPHTANLLLAGAAVLMLPCAAALVVVYRRIGSVPLAILLALGTAVLLLAVAGSGLYDGHRWLSGIVLTASLFAVNTMAATFLPVSADLAEYGRRARITGAVSFWNRLGGLAGPLVISLIVSSATDVLVAIAALALVCGAVAGYTSYRHRRASAALRATGTAPGAATTRDQEDRAARSA